jgi:signal peptidase I
MYPTLLVGDQLLVNRLSYGIGIEIPLMNRLGRRVIHLSTPKRGNVIVFIWPKDRSKDFIKRVIGLPGEKVEIREVKNDRLERKQEIYINDRLIEDPWGHLDLSSPSRGTYGPITVPPNTLFVMGDNRDNSDDSRFWGFVPLNNVLGKAFILYWSLDWQASSLVSKVRWQRIGSLIR